MSGTELEIGAQTRAATALTSATEPIRSTLSDLATSFEGAATGFKGASASALVEALTHWFEAANELPSIMHHYAANLMAVDTTEARSDIRSTESYGRLAGRLGGPQ
ncbi:hypothetical protein [Aeromicrobium sp.]|uniref:hypothetical protein n=1 Tax=Aeromicrobium sp. TaxID=1871063 RepID=UPI0019A0270A|nr:hypothetical protein [Aeromicrobium sp.]MBC7633922.1 hypothetical protein [Aeromicrobium sp.]